MDQMQLDKIWKSIRGELEVIANPTQFKAHMPGTYIKRIEEEDKLIEITTSSEFQKNFIEDNLS